MHTLTPEIDVFRYPCSGRFSYPDPGKIKKHEHTQNLILMNMRFGYEPKVSFF